MSELFLDTAYAIALSVETDGFHRRAVELCDQLEASHGRLVTTRAILMEIGNALSKPRYRQAATALLDAIEQDSQIQIVEITKELFQRALLLFRYRPDKDWGLIDCVSFVVMKDRGLADALTSDEHFEQAGFRALLRG